MLNQNPTLPDTAAPREFREEGGWNLLKSNNVSEDVKKYAGIEPLMWCKEDMLTSVLLFLEQSDTIIRSVVEEFRALRTELDVIIRSKGSYEQLVDFLVRRLLNSDLEARVADSCAHRGGRDWQSPQCQQAEQLRL
jgi:hypothetical protein